jgi:hypothetical protein
MPLRTTFGRLDWTSAGARFETAEQERDGGRVVLIPSCRSWRGVVVES